MQDTIDRSAFRALTSGLYVISAKADNDRECGCVVNTLLQVTSEPPRLLVSLNKDNATTKAILESGRFAATVLSQESTMELIGLFGFQTSTDVRKFDSVDHDSFCADIPYLTEKGLASFLVDVDTQIDVGTHMVFVGKVECAEVLDEGKPITYAYYHEVLRGKTPPKAASFNPDESAGTNASDDAPRAAEGKIGWRCTFCGYIVEGYPDGLPDDFVCPICQVGREFFEKVEI